MPSRTDPSTKPLTKPADLLILFGRYLASLVLIVATLIHLFQQNYVGAAIAGSASLFLMWATVRLWRRLRDERIAARAAREAAYRRASEEAL